MKGPSRRQALKGLGGVSLALPALDIFEPRSAAAEDKPTYAVFVVACNGVVQKIGNEPELFWPANPGALSEATLQPQASTRATATLSRYADKLLLVRGVNQSFKIEKSCAHTWGDNQALTAQPGSTDEGGGPATSLALGESIDNRIAREKNVGGRGPLTLHAGSNAAGGKGYGNPGYVSYRGPKQPNSPDSSPWEAYTRIVGLNASDPALVTMVATRRKSVNDLVRAQLQRVLGRRDLSKDDRRRLDQHLSSVRDMELGMTASIPPETLKAMQGLSGKDAEMRVKVHLHANRDAVVRLHMDLIAFAFAGDITRAATLKIGDNNDGLQTVIDGMIRPSFHMISHRVLSDGGNAPEIPGAQQLHARIVRMLLDHFGYLADKLAASSSPTGSLLDRGYAVWTNQIANGAHAGENIPYVVIGKANGKLKAGHFVDAGGISHNKLMNSLLTAADVKKPDGAPIDDFGQASLPKGTLSTILV